MKKITKEVVATKMLEVYAEDHAKLKEKAAKRGMSLRAYMHYLAEKEEKQPEK